MASQGDRAFPRARPCAWANGGSWPPRAGRDHGHPESGPLAPPGAGKLPEDVRPDRRGRGPGPRHHARQNPFPRSRRAGLHRRHRRVQPLPAQAGRGPRGRSAPAHRPGNGQMRPRHPAPARPGHRRAADRIPRHGHRRNEGDRHPHGRGAADHLEERRPALRNRMLDPGGTWTRHPCAEREAQPAEGVPLSENHPVRRERRLPGP